MKYSSIVEAIYNHSLANPGKLCIADAVSEYTYGEFFEYICRFAGYFRSEGIGRGDAVVIEACQSAVFPAMEFGLHLSGAVFVPVENGCGPEKIMSTAESCHAKMTVDFKSLREICGRLPCVSLSDYISDMPAGDAISEILFSTGTTGKEKGITLSHANDIAVAENIVFGSKMAEDNIELIPSPLNHSHGLRSFYANMLCGGSVVLHDGLLDLKGFYAAMDKYHINSIDLVPAALSIILRFSGNKLSEYKGSLRYVEFGSAAIASADKLKICSLLPNVPLLNYYGSTESGRATVFDFNAGIDKPGCIGKPTVNTTVVIVDEDHVPIHSSKEAPGLLACSGPMTMLGYFSDEEETKKAMDGDLVISSDEAYIDGDGDIILLGRRGDVINVGGKKVSPEDIENLARQYSCVADCGCKAVSDPITGQAPRLFIQLTPGCDFDKKDLIAFLSAHLEPFKVPKHIEIIDEIPRTFNGKLLRRKLP